MFKVKMHPKPMIRHTKYAQDAMAVIRVVQPPVGSGYTRAYQQPGVYITLKLTTPAGGTATQLVIIHEDQIDELFNACKEVRAYKRSRK